MIPQAPANKSIVVPKQMKCATCGHYWFMQSTCRALLSKYPGQHHKAKRGPHAVCQQWKPIE